MDPGHRRARASGPASAWSRSSTTSTPSSPSGRTCRSTAATSGCPGRTCARRPPSCSTFAQLTDRADEPVEPLSGGMKRRLTIAALAGQRPRAAAARRAHHRPRPAGPAPAVGAALPAQARGRHPDHHHALHGRGRAAVRPARGHGRRRDRRRGLARRADRAPLHPRGAGAAVRARGAAPACDSSNDLAERVEELPDRLLLYTDDGEHVHAQVLERGPPAASALVRRSTLEDVFLRLTGRTLVD